MEMINENKGVVILFQKRRKKFIRYILRLSLPCIVVGFLLMVYSEKYMEPINDSFETMLVPITGLLIFAVGIISFTKKAYKDYRCPKCGNVPMSTFKGFGTGGLQISSQISLNPSQCSSCGAKLK